MIDWVTILLALVIIAALVGGFGFVAWKINMSDPLTSADLTGKKDDGSQLFDSVGDRKRKDKTANDQKKKKRTVQKKTKRDDEAQHVVKFVEPSGQTSEETDNEREESEQVHAHSIDRHALHAEFTFRNRPPLPLRPLSKPRPRLASAKTRHVPERRLSRQVQSRASCTTRMRRVPLSSELNHCLISNQAATCPRMKSNSLDNISNRKRRRRHRNRYRNRLRPLLPRLRRSRPP